MSTDGYYSTVWRSQQVKAHSCTAAHTSRWLECSITNVMNSQLIVQISYLLRTLRVIVINSVHKEIVINFAISKNISKPGPTKHKLRQDVLSTVCYNTFAICISRDKQDQKELKELH